MPRKPDYSPDYNVTTGTGKTMPAVVRPFTFGAPFVNGCKGDYRSQFLNVVSPVVMIKALNHNNFTNSDYFTTSKFNKKKMREGVALARYTRAKVDTVDRWAGGHA